MCVCMSFVFLLLLVLYKGAALLQQTALPVWQLVTVHQDREKFSAQMILGVMEGLEDDNEEELSEYEDQISLDSVTMSLKRRMRLTIKEPTIKEPVSSHRTNRPATKNKQQGKNCDVLEPEMDRKTPYTRFLSKKNECKTYIQSNSVPCSLMC